MKLDSATATAVYTCGLGLRSYGAQLFISVNTLASDRPYASESSGLAWLG